MDSGELESVLIVR